MYYFLDVDGVLNKESDWRRPFTVNQICVKHFKRLIRSDRDAHIILSSTWRQGFTGTGAESPGSDSVARVFEENGIHIEGVTPASGKSRQEEIEYYIRRHGVSDYLVLDDDESLFPRPADIHLYLTDYRTGLTNQDVNRILKRIKRR